MRALLPITPTPRLGKPSAYLGMLLGLIALYGLSACSSEPIERFVELHELRAAAVEQAGNDCDALQAALESFQKEHGQEMEDVERSLMDLGENGKEELEDEYGDRLRAASMTVAKAQARCRRTTQ